LPQVSTKCLNKPKEKSHSPQNGGHSREEEDPQEVEMDQEDPQEVEMEWEDHQEDPQEDQTQYPPAQTYLPTYAQFPKPVI